VRVRACSTTVERTGASFCPTISITPDRRACFDFDLRLPCLGSFRPRPEECGLVLSCLPISTTKLREITGVIEPCHDPLIEERAPGHHRNAVPIPRPNNGRCWN